jgi:transposase
MLVGRLARELEQVVRHAVVASLPVQIGHYREVIEEVTSLATWRNTVQALALRARIVLACADGAQNKEVAARLQVDKKTVAKWRRRFVEHRLDGLRDEPRSGTPRTIDDARIEALIVRTLESTPPDAPHWNSRGMARQSGLSISVPQLFAGAMNLPQKKLCTGRQGIIGPSASMLGGKVMTKSGQIRGTVVPG